MMYFIVYSEAGEIQKTGVCPDADFANQDPDGRVLEVDGLYSFNQGFVKDGKFVLYSPELQAKRMSWVPGKTWSSDALDWV